MADEKLYVLASDVAISEQKSNDIFLLVEMRILSTQPNGNAEGVTPQFIDEVVAHPEKYACLPLYADVERLLTCILDTCITLTPVPLVQSKLAALPCFAKRMVNTAHH